MFRIIVENITNIHRCFVRSIHLSRKCCGDIQSGLHHDYITYAKISINFLKDLLFILSDSSVDKYY